MRTTVLFILIAIFQLVGANAQSNNSNGYKNDAYFRLVESYMDDGQISIYTDSLIVENYYKHLLQNKQNSGIQGYRIRIFSESGVGAKDRQKKVRAKFLSLHEDIDAYYSYDGLNFKVYVGDCRTRSEAAKLFESINKNFPNAIVVRDNISIEGID